jgi:hypothetical protein
MPERIERFFISMPTRTSERKKHGDKLLSVYRDHRKKELFWSGEFELPTVGCRVYIARPEIGWARVKGYFTAASYVGVMTIPLSPPVWWLQQQAERRQSPGSPQWMQQGITCNFGDELSGVDPSSPPQALGDVALTLLYCLETFEANCQCGKCDPCTRGARDIKQAIETVEELKHVIAGSGQQQARFLLQRSGAKVEFADLNALIDFVRDLLPPGLMLKDDATPDEIAAFASRNNWTLIQTLTP